MRINAVAAALVAAGTLLAGKAEARHGGGGHGGGNFGIGDIGKIGSGISLGDLKSTSASLPASTGTGAQKYTIRRKTVRGVVRSIDPAKWVVMLEGDKGELIPVEAKLALLYAGKTAPSLTDIRLGDRIRVYGEVTIQGGIRGMEIHLPKPSRSQPVE